MGDLFVTIFDQVISRGDISVPLGVHKLFLEKANGRFRIVGNEYQKIYSQPASADQKAGHPILASISRLSIPEKKPEERIAEMIDDWIQAWSSKDIDRYGNHYASDFSSQGMNRTQWLTYKDGLNRKYKTIQVNKKNLVIEAGKETSQASFIQTYESSGYRAVGIKRLILKQEGDQWKIYREMWEKM
jgi:hypothetical protein